MLIGIFFSFVLIIPFNSGNTLDKIEDKTNTTSSVPNPIPHNVHRKTNITVASEGGAIMSNTPSLSLLKENVAIPMISAKEISSNKVKARKGAILNSTEDNEDLMDLKKNDSTNNDIRPIIQTNVNIGGNNIKNNYNSSVSNPQSNRPNNLKPPILSSDAMETDEINNDPSIDKIDRRPYKIDKMNTNGHADMVMPIVITILVVPMFAVIGYMALKRGQEAWKNRHYKRMDFLLDGMYND